MGAWNGWFGRSWGAPVCDPNDHVATPVGRPCMRCREPIRLGDQGIVMPFVTLERKATIEPTHIDCYFKSIMPHGPDCPHCRGGELDDHANECAYRLEGGNCSCALNPFSS